MPSPSVLFLGRWPFTGVVVGGRVVNMKDFINAIGVFIIGVGVLMFITWSIVQLQYALGMV